MPPRRPPRRSTAKLLAPRNYERGMTAYTDAEDALARGRNIETVRSHAADATQAFRTAKTSADLARVKLAQVMKSRQDAANARAPELSPEIWDEAQRKFADAIRLLERGDLKIHEPARNRGDQRCIATPS